MKNIIILIFSILLFTGCQEKLENKKQSTASETSKSVADPLPSWKEGATKNAVLDYVKSVTNKEDANFIPVADRIATFDNDGTLWSEQPSYFQFFFALDRIKLMAKDHPEWKNTQPFKAVLEDDMKSLNASGKKGVLQLLATSHTGMSTEVFEQNVKDWLATSKHPRFDKPYNQLVYQPMLELLDYLKANNFKTFIVSGGGIEFMRPWVEETYGIPKNQVIGSSIVTEFDYNDGKPIINRLAKMDFVDDKEGKPLGINKFIGRKPVFAAGNSDGDLQMMQWADSNKYNSFQLYVHHTDAEREWAYDRDSNIGKFDKGLDEAKEQGWTIVDMKDDWKVIYPFEMNK